ncbi:MAG: 2-oxo acid dehydrogenase subunit E2 [Rubrivivax sp.]
MRYPEFNGFWRDGAFVRGSGIHVGVAVSLREGGLVAPALHDAQAQDVATLTRALLDLRQAHARRRVLRSSELADATITVTNLGDQGVASVFGVIYPPQVALVGFRASPRGRWRKTARAGAADAHGHARRRPPRQRRPPRRAAAPRTTASLQDEALDCAGTTTDTDSPSIA